MFGVVLKIDAFSIAFVGSADADAFPIDAKAIIGAFISAESAIFTICFGIGYAFFVAFQCSRSADTLSCLANLIEAALIIAATAMVVVGLEVKAAALAHIGGGRGADDIAFSFSADFFIGAFIAAFSAVIVIIFQVDTTCAAALKAFFA